MFDMQCGVEMADTLVRLFRLSKIPTKNFGFVMHSHHVRAKTQLRWMYNFSKVVFACVCVCVCVFNLAGSYEKLHRGS